MSSRPTLRGRQSSATPAHSRRNSASSQKSLPDKPSRPSSRSSVRSARARRLSSPVSSAEPKTPAFKVSTASSEKVKRLKSEIIRTIDDDMSYWAKRSSPLKIDSATCIDQTFLSGLDVGGILEELIDAREAITNDWCFMTSPPLPEGYSDSKYVKAVRDCLSATRKKVIESKVLDELEHMDRNVRAQSLAFRLLPKLQKDVTDVWRVFAVPGERRNAAYLEEIRALCGRIRVDLGEQRRYFKEYYPLSIELKGPDG